MPEIIDFKNFSGLSLDAPQHSLNSSDALIAEDWDLKDGKLRGLVGNGFVFDTGNSVFSGREIKSVGQFKFTQPTEHEPVIVYSQSSGGGDHRLHMRPHIANGVVVDSWQELTEHEGTLSAPLTLDAGTTTTTAVISALTNSNDDYYNDWIYVNLDAAVGPLVTLVTDYVGSTKTIIQEIAFSPQAAGDTVFLARYPLFKENSTSEFIMFEPEDNFVEFVPGNNSVSILTGANKRYPLRSDIHVSYINRNFFDNAISRNGTWATSTNLPVASLSVSTGTGAETNSPVTQDVYAISLALVYDGFQQGLMDPGQDASVPGTKFAFGQSTAQVQVNAADLKIEVSISIFKNNVASIAFNDDGSSIFTNCYPYVDARVTHCRLYLTTIDDNNVIESPLILVKEVSINSSDWFDNTTDYHIDVDILQSDIDSASAQALNFVKGHSSYNQVSNVRTSAFVGERRVYGNVFSDIKRESFIIFSPISSAQVNTPDVKPLASSIDASVYGIDKIMSIKSVLDRAIVFGETKTIFLLPTSVGPALAEEVVAQVGLVSKQGAVSVEDTIYFCSEDNIYALKGIQLFSISNGKVRDLWESQSSANKSLTVAGYDLSRNVVIFSIPASPAFALLYWPAIQQWSTYNQAVAKSNGFFTNSFGKLISASPDETNGPVQMFLDDQDILSSTNPSNRESNPIWQTKLFEFPVICTKLKMSYKSEIDILVSILDSGVQVGKKIRFPANSFSFRTVTATAGYRLERWSFKIEFDTTAISGSPAAMERAEIERLIVMYDLLQED